MSLQLKIGTLVSLTTLRKTEIFLFGKGKILCIAIANESEAGWIVKIQTLLRIWSCGEPWSKGDGTKKIG